MKGTRDTRILDRYLLGMLAGPLSLSIGVVLVALLLERLLRLFNLVAASSSALSAVADAIVNLVPYYLGLALPAAFFASIFMVVARLGDDNELDAMLAAGRSILQLARPFVLVAGLLAIFAFYLYGYLQPHSRYRYRAVLYEALHEGWNARAQENVFADAGRGFTLTADEVDASGRHMKGVFIRRLADGYDEIITARTGTLLPTPDGHSLQLELGVGRSVREQDGIGLDDMHFQHAIVNENFDAQAPPFRPRGNSERELTLPELWSAMHEQTPPVSYAELAGEFHARLARSAALPFLPLLAFALGMAAKRGQRAPSVALACLLLLALHHGIQFGESLAQTGRVSAVAAVWSPLAVFAALSCWLFAASLKSPGDNPMTRMVARSERLMEGISLRRKKAAP
ncbi:YjgP/YjgQ family permease [Solimonas sp. C16B3]|uniref:YjgP/YjgQ family permease n=1 Tax=Solimonas marina TaxID=2714601 RepID=A0A969WB59_9GAMM|nr:YjgP/YjgQ family permease [Solimonas marina]